MNDFVRPESMEVPEGGLASFLTATVGEWADDDVPQTGIAGLESVADKLAEYGRYEDTYMVHAAEGETVIPMAVFDENPRLKESLFNQMRAMGIDPEQYVVGNELNSLNPVTGQPEFFLKKFFKENEAIKHEESTQPAQLKSKTKVFHPLYGDVTKWLDRIKGE